MSERSSKKSLTVSSEVAEQLLRNARSVARKRRKRATVLAFIDGLTREDARVWLREIVVGYSEEQLDNRIRAQNLTTKEGEVGNAYR